MRRWSKHSRLSADDRAAILALPYTPKTFGKDAYLVREGQAVTDCALLLRGFAFRQKVLRDGSRQIISFHVPTEFVDLQNALLGIADDSVQSANRTLQGLRRDGLIYLNSGSLRILDWEGLREAGDFDELYLHQRIPVAT